MTTAVTSVGRAVIGPGRISGATKPHITRLGRFLFACNCDLRHRSTKRAVHLTMKTRSMHMIGYGLHLFRKDAVPHSVLVVAIILVVVLLII